MEFVYLTYPEVEDAKILCGEVAPKTAVIIAAALKAGFSEVEVSGSPLGVLQEDFVLSRFDRFQAGSRALIGMNGGTLLEVSKS